MTATSIMREDALYKKKQAEEKAIIENYENNLRDGSEFYEWQAEMKAKDEALLQYQVNQRRREMAESAINAIEAKDKDLAHKKAVADEMKVESHQMQQKLKEEAEQRRLYNQQIASDVRDIEEYARISVQAAYEKRVENARAVKEEREEIEKKVAEQMELERQRKADQVTAQGLCCTSEMMWGGGCMECTDVRVHGVHRCTSAWNSCRDRLMSCRVMSC